jgi:FkbM family methyltransferase
MDNSALGLFINGTLPHEKNQICFLENYLLENPDSVFYDIGANIGFYTLYFSQLKFRTKKIFTFEPNPQLAKRLERTFYKNVKVEILPFGVGEVDDILSLYMDIGSSDTATFRKQSIKLGNRIENIKIHTLDGLIKSGSILAPNLIKIDIEGFEYYAFKGFVTKDEFKPLILMEWVNEFMGSINLTFTDFKNIFNDDWLFYNFNGPSNLSIVVNDQPVTRDIVIVNRKSINFNYLLLKNLIHSDDDNLVNY